MKISLTKINVWFLGIIALLCFVVARIGYLHSYYGHSSGFYNITLAAYKFIAVYWLVFVGIFIFFRTLEHALKSGGVHTSVSIMTYVMVLLVMLVWTPVYYKDPLYLSTLLGYFTFISFYFFLGLYCGDFFQLLKVKAYRVACITATALFLAYLLWWIYYGYTLTGKFQLYQLYESGVGIIGINYIDLTESLAVIFLLIFSFTRTAKWRSLLAVAMIAILISSLSRATLVEFAGALICFTVIKSLSKRRVIYLFILSAMIVLLFCLIKVNPEILNKLQNNRSTEIFYNMLTGGISTTESDTSLDARLNILDQNLESLKDYWFFGHFWSELSTTGRGYYIHNWLSFWASYGLIPFLCFAVVYIRSLIIVIKKWRMMDTPFTNFVLLYGIYVLIAIIGFRSYVFHNAWLALGALAMAADGQFDKYVKPASETEREKRVAIIDYS